MATDNSLEMENRPGVNHISLVRNPLGIISLFVFFIEAIATVSLNIAVDTEYTGHIVWFIIMFPTLIVLLFLGTLWTKRECLYSPGEFRDDESFLGLIKTVKKIEIKQAASEIDVITTELSDVFLTLDRLLTLGDLYGAVTVGRGYLKQKQHEKCTQIFMYLKKKVDKGHPEYYKIPANLSYSLIGEGRYEEALRYLAEVRAIEDEKFFRAWHAMPLSYCYWMLGDHNACRHWLEIAQEMPEFKPNVGWFKSLYPELGPIIELAERDALDEAMRTGES